MKKLLLLTPLLLFPFLGSADVVIVENVESPVLTGQTTIKIKGDLMRIEAPLPGGLGSAATITDLAKGKATVLMAAQKMAMDMDLSALKKQAQAQIQSNAVSAPKDTGQKEKIGDWNAEIYELTIGPMSVKIWSSADFPNGAAIKQQLDKVSKATAGPLDLSRFNIPGVPVKTEISSPQMKMTNTIVSVKETPVADSEFTIPADYQKMAAPQVPGVGH